MTGDRATRLALGVAVGLGIVLAVGILLTDRGGPRPGGDAPATRTVRGPGGGVSFDDSRVLAQMRPWIQEWNVASEAWVKALTAGREPFLRVYSRHTRTMDVDSLRIRLAASRIAEPNLRRLLRRLGDAYRRQVAAVQEVNGAVLSEDGERGSEAIAELERADDARLRAATELIDAYPELAGDLSRLK
jgi:hypothetical protein